MTLWKELSAILLMAHLVSLPTGKMDGDFEKILPGNFSLENKTGEATNESINTFLPSNGEHQNFSTTSEIPTTSVIALLEHEKKVLEEKLEETLKSAISSGQVIMIAGTEEKNGTQKENSTPLILVEATSSQSSIDKSINDDVQSGIEQDQDIAQSQQYLRAIPHNYFGNDDNENIEELLAITGYEPQKLDASKIKDTSDGNPKDHSNAKVVTSALRPEEQFYDVPKRQNSPKDNGRTSDGTRRGPNSNPEESQSEIKISSNPNLVQKQQVIPRFRYSELFEKNPAKLIDRSSDWVRGPRHLKPATEIMSKKFAPFLPKIREGNSRTQLNETGTQNYTISEPIPLNLDPKNLNRDQVFLEKQNNYYPLNNVPIRQEDLPGRPSDTAPVVYPKLTKNYVNFAPSNRQLPLYVSPLPEKKQPVLRKIPPPEKKPPRKVQQSADAESSEEKEYDESDNGSDRKNLRKSVESVNSEYYQDSTESETAENQSAKKSAIEDSSKEIAPPERTSESYEDEEEPKPPKLYVNSAVPIARPLYDSYGRLVITDGLNLRNQQNYLPYVDPRRVAKTYGNIPVQPNYQTYGYPATITPVTPINYLNPAYYNYQNGQINPLVRAPQTFRPVTGHLPKNLLTTSSYESYEEYEEKKPNRQIAEEETNHPRYVDPYSHIYLTTAAPTVEDYGYIQDDKNYLPVVGPSTHDPSVSPKSVPNPSIRLSSKNEEPNIQQGNSQRHYVNRAADYNSHDLKEPIQVTANRAEPNEENLPNNAQIRYPVTARTLLVDEENSQRSQKLPIHQTRIPYVETTEQSAKSDRRVKIQPNEQKSPKNGKNRPKIERKISGHPQRSPNVHLSQTQQVNRRIEPVRPTEVPAESNRRIDVVEDGREYQDEVAEGTGHEEHHEKKHEDHHEEKGGGEKHEEDHHSSEGEKADKGYKEWHEFDKGKKGHHDKESHENEYHDHKGDKKKHEDESGYHEEHHKGEKGSKHAEFGEKGKHQKGHSTKGEHVIHKKDEYEKKTEFYDESHEEDSHEKEGGYHHDHEHEKGGHEKHDHHDGAYHEDEHGEKGEHEKGHHWHEDKGHDDKEGESHEHHHEEKYGKKEGHEEGEKWSHEKGHKRR